MPKRLKEDEFALIMRKNRSRLDGDGGLSASKNYLKGIKHHNLGPSRNQRVQVQFYISAVYPNDGGKGLKNHLSYIEREGAGKDGEAPELFGNYGEEVKSEDFCRPIKNEKRYFRFMLSPENGQDMDMKKFTRMWIGGLETYLGKKVDWVASEHQNTEHPHTHIIIRGKDKIFKKDLTIPKEWMFYESRKLAGEVATDLLGYRSKTSMKEGLDRLVSQDRITSLDTALQAKLRIGINRISSLSAHQKRRLEHLATLNLATKNKETFMIPPETFDHLKGESRLLNIKAKIRDRIDSAKDKVKREGNERIDKIWNNQEDLSGEILRVGKEDVISEKKFALIQNNQGVIYYVANWSRYKQKKQEGERVVLKGNRQYKNKKTDKKER